MPLVRTSLPRVAFSAVVWSVLGGCAGQFSSPAGLEALAGIDESSHIRGVPHFEQQDHECGPSALASVLGFAGMSRDLEVLRSELYSPTRKGALQLDFVAAARREGALAYELRPTFAALLTEVAAHHPIVVLQNRGLSWYPLWHYAVVTGYDRSERIIELESGDRPDERLPFTTFEHTWARSSYWALAVLPQNDLPTTAEPARLIPAAQALARAGHPKSARDAYEAALIRWPGERTVLFAAATAAMEDGDTVRAEEIFQGALQRFPNDDALLNNYAQLLARARSGCKALEVATRAVVAHGPFNAQSLRTLEELQRRFTHVYPTPTPNAAQ